MGIDLETEKGKEQHKFMFRKYLEGLQWVMHYYYSGIKSWRWFYPFHYPPMISDFEKIKEFLEAEKDAEFAKGFADAELLAFPLWAILDLQPTDLEKLQEGFQVGNLPNRKFSVKVLEVIKGVRFNKNPQERIKSELITPDAVKGEMPKQLLGSILQVSQSVLQDLHSSGDIK